MAQDSIASHYKGKEGEKYSKGIRQDVLNHFGFQLQKKPFIKYLNKDMDVLDFGCGNGSLAKTIQQHVNSIEGVEVNDYARNMAIKKQGLHVYESLKALPKEKKYDAIISNHVLEHVPNVIETLKTLNKHIKPCGLFITILPIDDFRSKNNSVWKETDPDHHLHTWTPLLFGNTLYEAGFFPQKLEVITSAWDPRFFFLGDGMLQSIVCHLLSIYFKRRQLFAIAVVRDKETDHDYNIKIHNNKLNNSK